MYSTNSSNKPATLDMVESQSTNFQSTDWADVALKLCSQLVRNKCVNTNAPDSGNESRSVETLSKFLNHNAIELFTVEPLPGRGSLVARIYGSDASAPSLGLHGHLDVVPATQDGWTYPPFSGTVADGFLWGRGVVDMLHTTACMATAMRAIAESGQKPKGDLLYIATADEESGGELGSGYLVKNHRDKVACDYLITEWGGVPIKTSERTKYWVTIGQKGGLLVRCDFKGSSSHASRVYKSNNALLKATQAAQRIAQHRTKTVIDDDLSQFINGLPLESDVINKLLDPNTFDATLGSLNNYLAALLHARTHLTIAPTDLKGPFKSNTIPGSASLYLMCRYLPTQNRSDVLREIEIALGDLAEDVKMDVEMETKPSESATDTPLWDAIEAAVSKSLNRKGQEVDNPAKTGLVPHLTPGGNDGGFYRELGAVVYGFSPTSGFQSIEEYASMFHAINERIDIKTFDEQTRFWIELVNQL